MKNKCKISGCLYEVSDKHRNTNLSFSRYHPVDIHFTINTFLEAKLGNIVVHFYDVFLNTSGVAASQDAQKLIIRNKEKSGSSTYLQVRTFLVN